MEDPQVFDAETLSKLGMINTRSQHIVANMINSWIPVLAPDRIESLHELVCAMKQKTAQVEKLTLENRELMKHGTAADGNKVNELKRIIAEKDQEISQLKNKRHKGTVIQEATQGTKGDCVTLQREIRRLNTEIEKMQKDAENKNAEFQGRYSTVHTQAKKAIDEKEAHLAMAITVSRDAICVVKAFMTVSSETSAVLEGMKSNIIKQQTLQDRLVRGMSSFYDTTTHSYMVYPIPTRSGYLMPIKAIIHEWLHNPSNNQEEVHSTFRCALTGGDNSIAPPEQIGIVRRIAKDLGISLKSPVTISVKQGTDPFHELQFFEQLRIIACLCKMYRNREQEPEEALFLYKKSRFIKLKITKDADKYKMDCEYGVLLPSPNMEKIPHQVKLVADQTLFAGLILTKD